MVNTYIPERGDVVVLNFNPNCGREQAGKRPAVVVSPKGYNEKVGLMICCPVTSQVKQYPFEVSLGIPMKTGGVVLVDHVKNLDWRVRDVRFIEKVSLDCFREILLKLRLVMGLD